MCAKFHVWFGIHIRSKKVFVTLWCHVSHVRCHVSHVTCHITDVMCFFCFFYKVLKLVSRGSVINGAYPLSSKDISAKLLVFLWFPLFHFILLWIYEWNINIKRHTKTQVCYTSWQTICFVMNLSFSSNTYQNHNSNVLRDCQ